MKPNLSWILLLTLSSVVVTLSSVAIVRAQTPPDDPLRDVLFPPELLMQNQQALGLTEDQKNYLKSELAQAQAHFVEQQWKLQEAMERLVSMLRQANVDEQATLSVLDNVLAAEREIKRTQVTLLIRIKNHLRPDQQNKLRQIRNEMRSAK